MSAAAATFHDDPFGVVTNSPTFDWHMTNLRNYLNFSVTDAAPVQLGSVKLLPTGQGTGMLGLPGDFTPPSRFVRAVALSQSVFTPKTGEDAVIEAFHVLNQFDIPKGAARDREKDAHGNVVADYTLWTSASDLKSKTLLLSNLREQPDPDAGSDEDEYRRQGRRENPDDGRRNDQAALIPKSARKIPRSPLVLRFGHSRSGRASNKSGDGRHR